MEARQTGGHERERCRRWEFATFAADDHISKE
jgi:hypothetical protein